MNGYIWVSLVGLIIIGILLTISGNRHGWQTPMTERQTRTFIAATVVLMAIGMIGAVVG